MVTCNTIVVLQDTITVSSVGIIRINMNANVSGIVMRPDCETSGVSGFTKIWPEETLCSATHTLVGCNVVNSISRGPAETIGIVTYSEYIDGEGVYYEATIEDDDALSVLENSDVRLSPKIKHESINGNINETYEILDMEFAALFISQNACDGVPDNPDRIMY